MGRNRGSRQKKRGKLNWRSRSANCGRRGGMGKSFKNPEWKTVRAHMLRRATNVVVPAKVGEEQQGGE